MVVLAIISLGVSMILPRLSNTLDQVIVHTVQFDFQRQITNLRRQAFLNEDTLVLGEPEPRTSNNATGGPTEPLTLRAGWRYALRSPLIIQPNGRCSEVTAELRNETKPPVILLGRSDCTFIRQAKENAHAQP